MCEWARERGGCHEKTDTRLHGDVWVCQGLEWKPDRKHRMKIQDTSDDNDDQILLSVTPVYG